jgi:hypothetical protein
MRSISAFYAWWFYLRSMRSLVCVVVIYFGTMAVTVTQFAKLHRHRRRAHATVSIL